MGARGKHRTEAMEVTEEKLRLGGKLLAATARPAGEKWAQGESIAQRPWRSQRGGLRVGAKLLAGMRRAAGEKWAQGEKHRTEATEVTEGKLRLGVKLLAATRRPAGEKWAQGEKHRTEVTEVTEGGTEVVGETASGDATRCWAKADIGLDTKRDRLE
jgi:intein/homing endonuclease